MAQYDSGPSMTQGLTWSHQHQHSGALVNLMSIMMLIICFRNFYGLMHEVTLDLSVFSFRFITWLGNYLHLHVWVASPALGFPICTRHTYIHGYRWVPVLATEVFMTSQRRNGQLYLKHEHEHMERADVADF